MQTFYRPVRKNKLIRKVRIQDEQIAEMRLYIEALKEVVSESRQEKNHTVGGPVIN